MAAIIWIEYDSRTFLSYLEKVDGENRSWIAITLIQRTEVEI